MTLPIFHIIRYLLIWFYSSGTQSFAEFNEELRLAGDDCSRIIALYNSYGNPKSVDNKNRIALSHCFYETKDTANMAVQLQYLSNSKNTQLRASYLNQLGLLTTMRGDSSKAIKLFREAIETENHHIFARQNFEYLSKVYKPNRKTPPSGQTQDQSESDDGGIVEKSDRQDELLTTQNPEIGLAQALQLLDALKKNEFNKILIVPAHKPDTTYYGDR